MKSKATLRYLRMSPQKVRLVLDVVRGMRVEKALDELRFAPQGAARPVRKLIESAVASAERKGGVDVDRLLVSAAWADGGPVVKRFRPRAHGRATPVLKRTSHITVVLDEAAEG